MDQELTEEPEWLGACGTAACIRVAHRDGYVLIATDDRQDVVVRATHEEWEAFKAGIHSGEIA